MPPARPCVIGHEASDDFDLLPDYDDSDDDDTQAFRRSPATSNKKKKYRNAFSMSNLRKSCSNLAALKNKGKSSHSSLRLLCLSISKLQSQSNMKSTLQVPASSTATRSPIRDRLRHHQSLKFQSTSPSHYQPVTQLFHHHHHRSPNVAATALHARRSKRPKEVQAPCPAQHPHPKTQTSRLSSNTSPPPLSRLAAVPRHSAPHAQTSHKTIR